MQHFKTACEPYYFMKEDALTGEIEPKMQLTDMIDEDKSLLNLVSAFIKQAPKYIQEKEQRENKEAKQEAKNKEIEKMMMKMQKPEEEEVAVNDDTQMQYFDNKEEFYIPKVY